MKDLISVAELAKELGISRVQVVRLIQAKKIAANKVGRSYVIRRPDIENYLIKWPVHRAVRDFGETLKRLGNG